jgi:hypothetical protein
MFWPLREVPPGYEEEDGLSTSEGNSVNRYESARSSKAITTHFYSRIAQILL